MTAGLELAELNDWDAGDGRCDDWEADNAWEQAFRLLSSMPGVQA